MADAIATAADYADAIMTARRAKNTLFLLLLLILLAQLALFFVGRYTNVNFGDDNTSVGTEIVSAMDVATSQPAASKRWRAVDLLEYVVGVTAFLGIGLTVVLATVLLLIVKIMLVGRLIGVARLTSAFIWTVALAVLLFPWQAFWEDYAFKLPGALYTWDELVRRVRFSTEATDEAVLSWMRFVGAPVLALIILLSIQIKSRRGLQQALGEAHYDSTTAPLA